MVAEITKLISVFYFFLNNRKYFDFNLYQNFAWETVELFFITVSVCLVILNF